MKAALRWFTGETGGLVRGVPLSEAWVKLRDSAPDRGCRARLYGLMRFCSAKEVAPNEISDAVLESYFLYRETTAARAIAMHAKRRIARTWNRCADTVASWPNVRLTEAVRSPGATPPWDAFPQRLRADIEEYLKTLTGIRRTAGGRRQRPLKPDTIASRRSLLIAIARRVVRIGVPIAELNSLAALLRPDRVERVLHAYWGPDETAPKVHAIQVAYLLVSIARETRCLSEEETQKLDDFRVALDQYRSQGLTDRNLAVIRQILTSSVWREVINLPDRLMLEARALRDQAPLKAALKAQKAVAIGLLTVAPVRSCNLAAIKLEENLIRPSGPDRPFWLIFPKHDVKNRIRLDFPLDERFTSSD